MFMLAMILMRLTTAGPMARRKVEDVVQRAVDPVADPDPLVLRLDVDVRRPVAQRLGDDPLHDLHDRCVLGDAGHLGLRLGLAALCLLRSASNARIWVVTPLSAR